MSTSGVGQSWIDTLVSCRCGFLGWVQACEDAEDKTTSWDCACGHHAEERWGDHEDD